MPKGADQKHIQLVQHSALDVRSLINAFSEPLLNTDIPIAHLLTRMDGGLENPNVYRIDAVKRSTIETHSRGMHCAHAQFPPEVVLAAKEVD